MAKLRIARRAEWDLDDRAAFWEERQPGLGRLYLDHLQEELLRLQQLLEIALHAQRYGEFHRFLTRRFSAQVFYSIENGDIIVEGVFDVREDPQEIARELSRRS